MDAANEVAAHHHELGYVQSPCEPSFRLPICTVSASVPDTSRTAYCSSSVEVQTADAEVIKDIIRRRSSKLPGVKGEENRFTFAR